MTVESLLARRYQLGTRVGDGGMGTVFRGLDIDTGETVAIKVLKSEVMLADRENVERFVREGEALRQLRHPNIVKLLAAFEDHEKHYLVMEYVAGGSLDEVLRTASTPLSIDRVMRIALDLCDALTRAHRLGIIHRDLKPANVLMADDGTPRLTDFGLAYLVGEERISTSGAVLGTFAYLSPETLKGEAVDARTDIWAFGVMLFEMLTGKPPFTHVQPAQTVFAIMTADLPDLEALRPDCPVALVDLVYRMLEKERTQRIPSVRQVAAELESILQGRTSAAPSGASPVRAGLPAQTTPFVGREEALAALLRLLTDPDVRLVTIHAPGGMGKTRLALEAAERLGDGDGAFGNGVFLVELASLSSPEFLLSAIAESVGFKFYPGGQPKRQLLDYFRGKRVLLVLDNFEHVLEGAAVVNDILQAAPGVKVIATSRERLGFGAETLFALSGMDFPTEETAGHALDFSGVRLFVESARRVKQDFELGDDDSRHVAQICGLVGGMPLGIVLAASWVGMLSPREIAQEIAKSSDFLETDWLDVPERQRSIRAVFDHSWNLLSDEERAVFPKLSLFRGGFTRDAAQAVARAGLRTLAGLMNKSLVRRNPETGRYEIHELLRQYAEGRLRTSPASHEESLSGHTGYYAGFLKVREPRLKSGHPKASLDEIGDELDNVRAAWRWMLQRKDLDNIRQAVDTLDLFYSRRASLPEAEATFRVAAETLHMPASAMSTEHARLLGMALLSQAKYDGAQGHYARAAALAAEAKSVLDEHAHRCEWAQALLEGGLFTARAGEFSEGIRNAERGLAILRTAGDSWSVANGLDLFAGFYTTAGDYTNAERCYRESIFIQESSGDRTIVLSSTVIGLGFVLTMQGSYPEGCRLMLAGLSKVGDDDLFSKTKCLANLANARRNLGEYAAAEADARSCLGLSLEVGNWAFEVWSYFQLGDIFKEQGRYDEAETYHRSGYRRSEEMGDPMNMALGKLELGTITLLRGRRTDAKKYFSESLRGFESSGHAWGVTLALNALGGLARDDGDYDVAERHLRRALEVAMGSRALPFATTVLFGMAALFARMGQQQRGLELSALVRAHPATPRYIARHADALQDELKATVAAEEFAAAVERGAAMQLETAVLEVLKSAPVNTNARHGT